MGRLDDELRRLVMAGVLREYQADSLRAAAQADAEAIRPVEPPVRRPAPADGSGARAVLIEVLAYIGGVLLLGAVGLLVIANWEMMGRGERITTSIVAAVLLLGSAAVVGAIRGPAKPASVLAALGACAAGFATAVAVEDTPGRVGGVIVALVFAAIGVWWLRGPSLLVATFAILSVGVFIVVFDLIDRNGDRTDTAGLAGVGFILVGLILTAVGVVRDQVTSWSLAGAAAFGSSMCWLVQERGELMALIVGTAGTIGLLVAYAKYRTAAYAVAGCAILLVVWPTSLYRLTENLAGVAIGLVIASAVLIVAVLVLSRCQHHAADSRT